MKFNSEFTESLLEGMGGKASTLVLDTNGVCSFASSNLHTTLGVKPEQLVGKSFEEEFSLYSLDGKQIDFINTPISKVVNTPEYIQSSPFFFKLRLVKDAQTYALNTFQIIEHGKVTAGIVQIRKATREVEVGEMKSLFLSFAAHQLKTPSSVVKGFLELMIRQGHGAYTQEQWSFLISAFESNEQLISVSKSLLNMARLEGGMIEPSITEFYPEKTIEHKVNLLKYLASLKGISIQIKSNYNSSEKLVASDEAFFAEILGIILGNAIKHAPDKSIINITYKTNREHCEVHVINTGSEVPKSVREALFKASPAEGIKNENHGLGLYIANKYIALLNGKIGLADNSASTDFYFIIPNHSKL